MAINDNTNRHLGSSGHLLDLDANGMLHVVLHEGTTISGHSGLTGLSYEASGHTGFASAADLATTSGTLQSQIDALDTDYATDAELATVSGVLQDQLDALDYFTQAAVTSLVTTTSGVLRTDFEAADIALDSKIDTVSGTINDAIEALDFYTTGAVDTLLLGKEDAFTEIDGGNY